MGPIMASSSHVVVIGAGILGLTAAIQIQDLIQSRSLPYKILLVAKDFPVITPGDPTTSPSPNYASMHAGAHVRPIPASSPQLAREARWLKRACQVFAAQATHEPWMGVIQVPGVEYFEDPVPEHYRNLDAESFHQQSGLTGFRRLDDATKLPKGVNLGYEYQTYCIYSSVYCAALLRKFILKGGQVLRQELKCEDEAFSLADRVELVVNASGMGFGDRNCFPIRDNHTPKRQWNMELRHPTRVRRRHHRWRYERATRLGCTGSSGLHRDSRRLGFKGSRCPGRERSEDILFSSCYRCQGGSRSSTSQRRRGEVGN
ncbi:hypothetical protein HRR76_001149 [Exophiala dermatitidis]|nr:hypothetical protein HRR76_001149 [Exophiala dermatitidis]KAJ4563731.1 hypothetical protein HRR82_009356 [Exophiala dermatitidis]KAJ4599928.1 hypothetical protein HRR85_009416 [Exophiala dermatitidis]KAJ4689827.1 hypothetical protein HRR87_009092 [Exophiala dermatitidis]